MKKIGIAIFFLLIVLCIYFKPWQLMFGKESKLNKDSNISFFVIDNNEYILYEKMLVNLQSDSSDNKRKAVNAIASDLLDALRKEQYKFKNLSSLDFKEVSGLYEQSYFDNRTIEKSRENLLHFLDKIKIQTEALSNDDFNYLLDFYFYYSCVVSFNKYWYLQPQMPISKTLVDGLLSHSLRLKQIYNFDSTANILEPIKVNFVSGGYNRIKSVASDELLSPIMVMPMLQKENSRNIEANNFAFIRSSLTSNPSYSLCVFYIP